MRYCLTVVAWGFVWPQLASAAPEAAGAPVSFKQDIAPILARKCLACHGPKQSKGDFRLDSFQRLIKPGSSDEPSIVAGHADRSQLYQRIVATDDDDRMPQKDGPLPPEAIKLIKAWIDQGAVYDGPKPDLSLELLIAPENHPAPPQVYAHPIPIPAVAFSPDGSILAVSGYHEVTLWNATNGVLVRRLTNITERTQSLAFHPTGNVLAVGGGSPGKSGEVRLINPADGTLLHLLNRTFDFVLAVRFNADGSRLAAAGADQAIRVFNATNGQEMLLIEQHADWVMDLAFDPTGPFLASASRDKSCRLFNLETGALEESYLGHEQPVFAIAFSPDGQHLFSGGRDRAIHVWERKGGKKIDTIGGFEGDVYRMSVAEGSVWSCAADGSLKRHEATGKHERKRVYNGHTDAVYSLDYHTASQRVAAGSYDGTVKIWDAAEGELIVSFAAAPGLQASRPETAPSQAQ